MHSLQCFDNVLKTASTLSIHEHVSLSLKIKLICFGENKNETIAEVPSLSCDLSQQNFADAF